MRARKIIGRAGLGVLALVAAAVFALLIVGVPRPPAVTARHVPRLSWRSGVAVVGTVRESGASLDSRGWPAGPGEFWISIGYPPQTRYLALRRAGDPGRQLSAIPGAATQLVGRGDSAHPVVVFTRYEGGSERSRLYSWEPGRDSATPLTPAFDRLDLCCVNPSGSLVAFGRDRAGSGESDVLVMDPRRPGSPRAIMSRMAGAASPKAWSADGRHLLVLEAVSFSRRVAWVADAATGQVERLVPAWGDTVGLVDGSWSRDGKRVFLVADAGSDFAGVQEVNIASRQIRALTSDLMHEVTELWRLAGGDTLVLGVNEDGRYRLYSLDPVSGRRWRLPTPDGHLLSVRVDPTEPRLAEVTLGATGRRAVHVLDMRTGTLSRWALGDPPRTVPPPDAEVRTYPTFDSVGGVRRRIDVIVRRPPATFNASWPVLIWLHGGPMEQAIPLPQPAQAFILRNGIAVLEPNFRGSGGFGKTFAALDDGRRREDAVRDVGALLDWIATRPEFDASRVAVIGGSYGGYLSLATLVHYSRRLRCGIDIFGFSSLTSFLEESVDAHFPEVQRAEYGDERDPRTRAFLDSISPINHAEQSTAPVLIYQGANDPRVKTAESRRMVARLESLGHTVWYVEAANEGHGFAHPLNQAYFGTVLLDFLKKYLLPDSMAVPRT